MTTRIVVVWVEEVRLLVYTKSLNEVHPCNTPCLYKSIIIEKLRRGIGLENICVRGTNNVRHANVN